MSDTFLVTDLDGTRMAAWYTEDRAVELRPVSAADPPSLIGTICIGKVKTIQKNINAAFVEIAGGRMCYYNLEEEQAPLFADQTDRDHVVPGDELIVQVRRDSFRTKLPFVTSALELAGNFLVLTRGGGLGFSGKLTGEEKERLRAVTEPFLREGVGWIVRTNAADAADGEVETEAAALLQEYRSLLHTAAHRSCYAILKEPLPPEIAMLRDCYSAHLSRIVTDIPEVYDNMHTYLAEHRPRLLTRLSLYADPTLPLFKLYRLEHETQEALGERVWLGNGGFLVIQPTEALTVIDVNSGKYTEKKPKQKAVLRVNLEAAKEAARQIRLRNLSGILIVDFINMEDEEDRDALLAAFSEQLLRDPVRTRLVDMTELGLVEVTRKKVRKPLNEALRKTKISGQDS